MNHCGEQLPSGLLCLLQVWVTRGSALLAPLTVPVLAPEDHLLNCLSFCSFNSPSRGFEVIWLFFPKFGFGFFFSYFFFNPFFAWKWLCPLSPAVCVGQRQQAHCCVYGDGSLTGECAVGCAARSQPCRPLTSPTLPFPLEEVYKKEKKEKKQQQPSKCFFYKKLNI